MTNAEKYLKDGVDSRYFATDLYKFILSGNKSSNEEHSILNYINTFLSLPVKPSLTEEEKTILRSFDPQLVNYISRDVENNITVSYKSIEEERNNALWALTFYNHKFQFIKERRRI